MWHLRNIPKTFFIYWGERRLSWLRYLTIATFQKFNPDWQIKFYYPKVLQIDNKPWDISKHTTKLECADWFDAVSKIQNTECIAFDFESIGFKNDLPEVYKSDIIRLYLLSHYGGIWSDMDIIYFKPMELSYLNNKDNWEIDTIICHNGRHYSIGFLGSNPGNLFYNDLFNKSKIHAAEHDYQKFGTVLWGINYQNEQSIKEALPFLNIANIKMELVYPYRFNQNTLILKIDEQCLDQNTIGLHWFAGHPDATEWENKLTFDNYLQYHTTVTNTIRRALC